MALLKYGYGLSQNEPQATRVDLLKHRIRNLSYDIKIRVPLCTLNLAEIVDQLTSNVSGTRTSEELLSGFTRLLIGTRRKGYHTWFYPSTLSSASYRTVPDWE